jgi:hypothetical protein
MSKLKLGPILRHVDADIEMPIIDTEGTSDQPPVRRHGAPIESSLCHL